MNRKRFALAATAVLATVGAANVSAYAKPATAARRPAARAHIVASATNAHTTATIVQPATTTTMKPPKITIVMPTTPCWYLPNQDCVSWEEYQQYLADKAAAALHGQPDPAR